MHKFLILAIGLMLAVVLMANYTPVQHDTVACGCTRTITKIHNIQGSGEVSPLVGEIVSVEAVVTADFSQPTALSGFFLQEEDEDADGDVNTSEGVFVYTADDMVDVMVGDLVCVTGTVAEHQGLTQLENVTEIVVCSSDDLPRQAFITLPLKSVTCLEKIEGMRVSFPQELTVTDTFNLGRYGEVKLSSRRLYSPTEVASPGESARAIIARNVLDNVILDDGIIAQNPDPTIFPVPELTARRTLRAGDAVMGVEGVLTYRRGEYMIEPTAEPVFVSVNPRESVAPGIEGQLRVLSFNVGNYFNGDGCGGGFPTARGAFSLEDFERQRNKLVKALVAVQADIIGLMEIENDGFGYTSAIHDLVAGMNAAAPIGTTYAYVTPADKPSETDEITVALVYRAQTVGTQGTAVMMPSADLPKMNRLPLVQTFIHKASGKIITVVANHLKSKGASSAHGLDRDQGDGQGCWNNNRTKAAEAILGWLATDPTQSGDPDVLVIGDLNCYTKEDPIKVLMEGGYTDLLSHFSETPEYTYVYEGEAGAIDHALASASLLDQVKAIAVWHINSDEPSILGYSSAYKSSDQLRKLYQNDPFRCSDHDPLIVDIDLE